MKDLDTMLEQEESMKKEGGTVESLSDKTVESLGSGQSRLSDEVKKAGFSSGRQTSSLSEAEIENEINIASTRARLRHAVRESIETMEYASLRQEALAARVEQNNEMLAGFLANSSLKRYSDRQKAAGARLDKALRTQKEVAGQLPPYSGMA